MSDGAKKVITASRNVAMSQILFILGAVIVVLADKKYSATMNVIWMVGGVQIMHLGMELVSYYMIAFVNPNKNKKSVSGKKSAIAASGGDAASTRKAVSTGTTNTSTSTSVANAGGDTTTVGDSV